MFTIRFGINRIPFRVMHRAVDNVDLNVVWPESYDYSAVPLVTRSNMRFFDNSIDGNHEQATAVAAITNKNPQVKNVPYLIAGPFGTGKTRTLVEAIYQVIRTHPLSRILLCTPSNRFPHSLQHLLCHDC